MVLGSEAVRSYVAVLTEPEPALFAALEPWLAEDVVVSGLIGGATGKAAVLEALAAPNVGQLVAGAEWSEGTEEDGELLVEARLPAGRPLAGMRFGFRFDAEGRIVRIGQQLMLGAQPEPQPLAISEEWAAMISGALTNGTPVIVAYVDKDGVPHLSPRGSVQVLNEKQVGVWIRDADGGLLKGIASNPNLAFYYRDPKTRAALTITGRGEVATDAATRDTIYENQPTLERNLDGRKLGIAVVVDVDLLEAAGPSGRVKMVR